MRRRQSVDCSCGVCANREQPWWNASIYTYASRRLALCVSVMHFHDTNEKKINFFCDFLEFVWLVNYGSHPLHSLLRKYIDIAHKQQSRICCRTIKGGSGAPHNFKLWSLPLSHTHTNRYEQSHAYTLAKTLAEHFLLSVDCSAPNHTNKLCCFQSLLLLWWWWWYSWDNETII